MTRISRKVSWRQPLKKIVSQFSPDYYTSPGLLFRVDRVGPLVKPDLNDGAALTHLVTNENGYWLSTPKCRYSKLNQFGYWLSTPKCRYSKLNQFLRVQRKSHEGNMCTS